MDAETFSLRWEEEERAQTPGVAACEEVIYNTQSTSYSNIEGETIIPDTDQMAAENLMYLAQDISYTEVAELVDDQGVECVTEEVITDDWVVPGGQERVEVPLEQLTQPVPDMKDDNDIDVPLPTDQDEYTAMRPYPCDFCSRRFRKKNSLVNHMVAHQSDRPHVCNLCGVRYVRKADLMNHLKVHAFVPEHPDEMEYDDVLENHLVVKSKKKRGRRKKPIPKPPKENGEMWENMTSARTQQWSRKRTAAEPRASLPPPSPPSPPSSPSPAEPPSPPPPPADPRRPFTCKHCGIGFAREKALQSHSRVHGGESPLECGACGELCWSREALASHQRRRHPNMPAPAPPAPDYRAPDSEDEDDDDIDYRLSPSAESGGAGGGGERPIYDTVRGPELFCQHCGVAFQRADLLRRHVAAAHSYKRHDSAGSSGCEHTCGVCGETCADALQLLAHAERHAAPDHRVKSRSKSRINTTLSNSRQFPCRECGKVFGSRSSQQIHVRIHTGERPYACRFCWKAFADGGTLRKHERIHTGEKPYACAVCPRAFNQRVVLREHVRSHHSAPDRRANGGPSYCCVVCGRTLHSSSELVQHLIQHCDANTALRRQPQSGPRKYKRRKKQKPELSPSSEKPEWSPPPSPPPAPPPPRARRRRAASPPPRPRMIHTAEDTRPRTKQVRNRRPPRHPADDLRAIRPHLPQSPPPPPRAEAALAPTPAPVKKEIVPKKENIVPKSEPSDEEEPERSMTPFRCEMCDLRFDKRDDLLMHVPVHI